MTDRVFDRVPQHDERNALYPIRALLPDRGLRSYSWRCSTLLDQGSEGACVGFGWAHELAARPREHSVDESYARSVYLRAKLIDEWPGENYSGTSVLAGAKVVQQDGHIGEYRWASGLSDVLLTLAYHGPVVLGVNWYTGMVRPDSAGYLHKSGKIEGGHCVLARGVSTKTSSVLLHNSWGAGWGRAGTARISFDDVANLLSERGDACVPVRRS